MTHDLSTTLPENKEEITSLSNANGVVDGERPIDYDYQTSDDTEPMLMKTEGVIGEKSDKIHQPQVAERDPTTSYSVSTTQNISTETSDSQESTKESVAEVSQTISEFKNETSNSESINATNIDYVTRISENTTEVQGIHTTLSHETTTDEEEETAITEEAEITDVEDDEEDTEDDTDYSVATTASDEYEEDTVGNDGDDDGSTEDEDVLRSGETKSTESTSTIVTTELSQPMVQSHAASKINHFSIVCSMIMFMSLYTI